MSLKYLHIVRKLSSDLFNNFLFRFLFWCDRERWSNKAVTTSLASPNRLKSLQWQERKHTGHCCKLWFPSLVIPFPSLYLLDIVVLGHDLPLLGERE